MNTGMINLESVEQFMADYVPVYQPIYPLLLSNSQAYSEQVGELKFKRVETVGDIRAHRVTPKDTEIKQIAVTKGEKKFHKYFLANQFRISDLQDKSGVSEIVARVLDEHQKQMDELALLGEGTAANNVLNNGLYWSADANYVLESSAELALGTAADHLRDMHAKIMASITKADSVAGRKVLMVYGSTAVEKFNSLYSNTDRPFREVLASVAGPKGYSLAEMPQDVTPDSANGWIIFNQDQVKLHYTALPALKKQGINDEGMYSWHNFMMGSCMVEVLASKGIIRQPVTFAAP